MKRILTALVILILFFTSAFGQKDTLPKKTFNAIKTDLVYVTANLTGLHGAAIIAEHGFLSRHSFQLTGAYFVHAINTNTQRIAMFIPEYKYFLNKKKGFVGIYTGVYFKAMDQINRYACLANEGGSVVTKFATVNTMTGGVGATFGFQTYIKKHLTLDFLVGLGGIYSVQHVDVPANVSFIIMQPVPSLSRYIDRRVCINLGYKF